MPYESPVLEITNFDLHNTGESTGQGGGNVCSPVTQPMPF